MEGPPVLSAHGHRDGEGGGQRGAGHRPPFGEMGCHSSGLGPVVSAAPHTGQPRAASELRVAVFSPVMCGRPRCLPGGWGGGGSEGPSTGTQDVFQWLSRVQLLATPWTAARQAALSITSSQSLPKLVSIESVMPSNHLILCRPLLLPSVFPSIS